ncbi:MAG: mevalonate kinase [Chloroflexi bacterium]|nr:mevalonate kinase [Chloroflexota bacterium]
MVTSSSACGKAILLGEHAVVYGQPALAVPLPDLSAYAKVEPLPTGSGIVIEASDLGRSVTYPALNLDNQDLFARGLQTTIGNALAALQLDEVPPLSIKLHSQLPPARGLGSGTAVTIAIIRALARFTDVLLAPEVISELAYRTEILYHGHPSGIDNTVIAYERPIYYQRGKMLSLLEHIPAFTLLIADSGIASQTRGAVEQVRRAWQAQPTRCEALFERIGRLTAAGRVALEAGDWPELGALMNADQCLLAELGVSSPEIERLNAAALQAGALGAKLSGGGQGGCIIALVDAATTETTAQALRTANARQVWKVDVHDADWD